MDLPVAQTLWGFVHVVSWATYVGGAVVMEFVWRPTQEHLPMSQIGVACQWMGRRYRWVALLALIGAGVSGVALVRTGPTGDSVVTPVILAVCWLVLAATLAMLTFVTHPGLHARTTADMTEPERLAARNQVRLAMRRMDLVLRIDLVIALVALVPAASLAGGRLL